jgi:hypothetical protein
MRFKSRKVYKKNMNKISRRRRKRVTKRILNRKQRVTRKVKGGGPKRKINIVDPVKETKKLAIDTFSNEPSDEEVIQENRQMSEEEGKILEEALLSLPNNQNKAIRSSFCVNGPDYFEIPGYCEFLAYTDKLPKREEEKIYRAEEIKREIYKRRGLLRRESGFYSFQELRRPEYIAIQLNKLIKMVFVKKTNGEYMILWSYANMLNYNYAEDYFKKWVTNNGDGTFTILSVPKDVVLITREIIEDIERDRRFNGSLVNGNFLLTRSYYPNIYNNIINQYFSSSGYDMTNTVFICPIYEISHSAIANNYNGPQLQMSDEVIRRPLIYAGLEAVFYRKDGKLYFVIANLSGHYKTPKDRMEFVKQVLERYYGYANIRIISDPPPSTPPSSIDSDDSSSEPRVEWRRFITNDDSITTFNEALDVLNSADQNPVKDSSTYETLFSQGSQGTGSIGSYPI